MGIQMNEAEGCPRLPRFSNQPFKRLGIWRSLLKGCVQRLFSCNEPLPGSYGVCLHLLSNRLDVVALLLAQPDLIR
jgi:hypothetical protein